MKPIIINQDSEDKDCANLHPIHYIAIDGKILWPASRAGQEVSVENN